MLDANTEALPLTSLGGAMVLALIVSALGFKRVVYFVSLGYAGSIAALAVAAGVTFHDALTVASSLQLVGLFTYGARLGGFLVARERVESYRRELRDAEARGAHLTGPVRVAIWLGVSALYVSMFSPALFNLASEPPGGVGSALLWLGLGTMGAGLALEAVADWQKSEFKRRAPQRFCDVGLYRWVRCPNYLGEVLFWLGQFVAGTPGYTHWSRWLVALAGLACIGLVMLGSTRRLELKQDERYGTDPAYQAYVRRVPVLLPLVPLFTLKRLRVYLG